MKRRSLMMTSPAFVLVFLFSLPALAQQRDAGEVSRLSTEVSNEIYSPFCPGKTLMMCPSPKAAAVRRDIQQMAKEGKEKSEIKQAILDTHGEEFRIVEPPIQDNVFLLSLIILGFILAIVAIFVLSRKLSVATRPDPTDTAKAPSTPTDDDLSDEERAYLEHIREEL